ncbi:MAG: acyl-CoA thioesterase [Planctomycetota bacterium]|jgi:acyl-CoA thioester hydrolase
MMGEPDRPRHFWRHTVRIFELDPYVHANHTAYLQWLEEGREGFLHDLGLSFIEFLEEETPLVMVNVNVNYTGQLRRGDVVDVETWVGKVGRTSVRFDHRIVVDGGEDVLRGSATMVFVGPTRRPIPVPAGFHEALGHDPAVSPEA